MAKLFMDLGQDEDTVKKMIDSSNTVVEHLTHNSKAKELSQACISGFGREIMANHFMNLKQD
jgi:hypothetical protein